LAAGRRPNRPVGFTERRLVTTDNVWIVQKEDEQYEVSVCCSNGNKGEDQA
jgi:hypothetical protein